MSDNTLTTLMGLVPTRCIVLLEDLDAAFTRSVSRDANSTGAPTAPTEKESNENKDKKDDGSTLSLSGLLNSLDGVAAAEGRLLFATTNHIERLDPALSRPGRMDVWVNFTYATKFQAEGIFKCFFPHKPTEEEEAAEAESAESSSQEPKDPSQQNLPLPKRKPITNQLMFSEEEIAELAKRFADSIPENELSVASLQGYLLKNKTRPRECVDEVEEWVKQERVTREKIKLEKEKAEREAKEKEKKAAEEKEKKEKEAKEKEGKEAKEKKAEKKERTKSKKTSRSDSSAKTDDASSTSSSSSATETSKDSTPASSSSESDNSTGTDGDTEESVTSEDETENKAKKTDKWVSVKVQAANAATPASAEESAPTTEGL